MKSNQRSPLWPYMLVLTGLFVLSVAVPRGWQDTQRHDATSHGAAPAERGRAADSADAKRSLISLWSRRLTSACSTPTDLLQQTTRSAEATLRTWLRVCQTMSRLSAMPMTQGANAKISRDASLENRSAVRHPSAAPMDRPIEASDAGRAPTPTTDRSAEKTAASQRNAVLSTAYWPVPGNLLDQLDQLAESPDCAPWALRAEELCIALCRTPPGDRERAATCVNQLQSLVDDSDQLLSRLTNPSAAAELRRVRYSIQRRLVVWNTVFSRLPRPTIFANIAPGDGHRQELARALANVDVLLRDAAYGDAWRQYLRLNDVAKLSDPDSGISDAEARQLARNVLRRIDPNTAASPIGRELLDSPPMQQLANPLRPLAADQIAAHEVLAAVEKYEESGLASDGRDLVDAQHRLMWSPDQQDRDLADQLDQHYRNANVRLVITEDLLNRLAPDPSVTANNVDDRILGNPVAGVSVTSTQVQIKLIPDPRRVHAWLEVQGAVDSNTRAYSGPATFRNRGEATFVARKAVVLDGHGLGIAPATSQADSDSRITSVSTDYDGIPVLRRIARNVAISEADARRGEARQEVEAKVASLASQELNDRVDQRLKQAEAKVRAQWLDPLARMDLQLEPIGLETAADRVTMRLRLAGEQQLGGHTARPQAPSDSLASAQVHQSALNNVLDELQLAGRSFELPDLYQHLADRTSRPLYMPDDIPDGVFVEFAEHDPVRVRCQNGRVELTLAIDELRQGSRKWHDFLITATYVPVVDGLHARLTREGTIKLGGDTYKGQTEVVLRGIFSKILSRDRTLDLVPSMVAEQPKLTGLEVTQCLIEDGWIGLAIGPHRVTTAEAPAPRASAITQ